MQDVRQGIEKGQVSDSQSLGGSQRLYLVGQSCGDTSTNVYVQQLPSRTTASPEGVPQGLDGASI